MTVRQITAATTNPAKLDALQRLVGDLARVVPLPFAADDPVRIEFGEEQGDTIEEIAAAKASGWSGILAGQGRDSLTIASDGGLLIPALGPAWDARRTRRFAGDNASDLERSRRLLDLAQGLTGDDRSISWQEAVAIANQGRLVGVWSASGATGRLATSILDDLSEHTTGFWIPALWEAPEMGFRRLAALTPEERIAVADHWTALREPVRSALARLLRAISHDSGVPNV